MIAMTIVLMLGGGLVLAAGLQRCTKCGGWCLGAEDCAEHQQDHRG